MRASLFWCFTQRRFVVADLSVQPLGLIFRVSKNLSIYAAYHPRRVKMLPQRLFKAWDALIFRCMSGRYGRGNRSTENGAVSAENSSLCCISPKEISDRSAETVSKRKWVDPTNWPVHLCFILSVQALFQSGSFCRAPVLTPLFLPWSYLRVF